MAKLSDLIEQSLSDPRLREVRNKYGYREGDTIYACALTRAAYEAEPIAFEDGRLDSESYAEETMLEILVNHEVKTGQYIHYTHVLLEGAGFVHARCRHMNRFGDELVDWVIHLYDAHQYSLEDLITWLREHGN